MNKIVLPFIILILLQDLFLSAQVSVSTDGSSAHSSSMLEVKSTDKGFLPPRMTTAERNSITNPAEGLVIYNTDQKALNVFDGLSWSSLYPFICGILLIDGRDQKTYKTVQIGGQCWMAENLNVGDFINGSGNQTNNSVLEKYCYDNFESNCEVFGGLYQWDEMMQYSTTAGVQGICPFGWHLPTDAEWCTLTTYIDYTVNCSATAWSGTNVGLKMREYGTSHWYPPNTGATNSSGFTGLPGGRRNPDGSFSYNPEVGYWWSSSQVDSDAWVRILSYDAAGIIRSSYSGDHGFSVRCIRN